MDSQRNETILLWFFRPRDAVSSRWRGLACTSSTAKIIMISITRHLSTQTSSFSPGVTVSDGNVNNACVDLKKTFALKWQNARDRCTLLGNKQADDRAGRVLLFPRWILSQMRVHYFAHFSGRHGSNSLKRLTMKFMKRTSYWKLHQMCFGYYGSHIYWTEIWTLSLNSLVFICKVHTYIFAFTDIHKNVLIACKPYSIYSSYTDNLDILNHIDII